MAQISLKKINNASKAECADHKKIRMIILILTLVGTLFSISEWRMYETVSNEFDTVTQQQVVEQSEKWAEFEGFFGLFFTFLAAAFGAFAVYGIFSDLANRQTADVQLSLPMNSKERYLSKLLALVKIHILPLLAGGLLLIVAGGIKTGVWSQSDELFRILTIVLAEALFVDAISIFCMTCCGAKAEGIYTSIITGICVSFTPLALYASLVVRFSGIDTIDNRAQNFSLFGALSAMWLPLSGIEEPDAKPWIYLVVNIALSCLLVFASYYIYRRRDARSLGKPIVYDLFMELFMFIGLFTVFTMFFSSGLWLLGMAVAAVIYLIIRIVAARAKINAKTFLIWLGKYAASLAVFLVISAAAYFTGGFGHYMVSPAHEAKDETEFRVWIDRYGEVNDDFYDLTNRKVLILDTEDKNADEKIDRCYDIIHKYYSFEGHTMKNFFKTIIYGYESGARIYQDNGYIVSISIASWSTSIEGGRDFTYEAEITVSEDDIGSFIGELKAIGIDEDFDMYYNEDDYGEVIYD